MMAMVDKAGSAPKGAGGACCPAGGESPFRVESVVTIDERGQMVLPKDLRERAGLGAGEKLAVISWTKDGEICCMSLIKTDALAEMVKDLLGPMMGELSK